MDRLTDILNMIIVVDWDVKLCQVFYKNKALEDVIKYIAVCSDRPQIIAAILIQILYYILVDQHKSLHPAII